MTFSEIVHEAREAQQTCVFNEMKVAFSLIAALAEACEDAAASGEPMATVRLPVAELARLSIPRILAETR